MSSLESEGKIAVTGANGFIGSALCGQLRSEGRNVTGLTRTKVPGASHIAVGEIGANTNWVESLRDVDCVIHCAARAHMIDESDPDSAAKFHEVNVLGTTRLAEEAANCGVRRLIFLSSIGVLGNETPPNLPFDIHSMPNPKEEYARSKLEAENALSEISKRTGLEIVIVRPPLVYGSSAPGNMRRLIKLIRLGIPLPLGSLDAKRSYTSLENLLSLLITCVDHPAAPGQTFLVSDGLDLTLSDLLKVLSHATEDSVRIFPFPLPLLRLVSRIVGKNHDFEKMARPLLVDISHTSKVLNWNPKVPDFAFIRCN